MTVQVIEEKTMPGVALHPVVVLFGVLAGEQISGVPGMLLSVPVMAIFRILWRLSVHE